MVLVSPLRFKIVEILLWNYKQGIDVQALVILFYRIEGLDTFCCPVLGNTIRACDAGSHAQQNWLWGYFNPVGAIEVKTDTCTNIFDLKIPIMQYSNDITTEGFTCNGLPIISNLTFCSDANNIFGSVETLHQRAAIKVNSLIKIISTILTIDKPGRRKQRHEKRGLINFVGTISHSLFGLVTDADLEAFGERFKTVFNNQERLLASLMPTLTN